MNSRRASISSAPVEKCCTQGRFSFKVWIKRSATPFSLLLAAVWNAPPPETWVPCEKCHGSGESRAWSSGCPTCARAGFALPVLGGFPPVPPMVYRPAEGRTEPGG
jgi:hypothetical protein